MKTIWTNGCFDILHIGHIALFEYAKSLGNYLVVGIDSDSRVKQLKGSNRPINNQYNRKKILDSIKFIDKVIIFNNKEELIYNIKQNNIDTIVVGDDYIDKTVIGSDIVSNIYFFKKIINISTSNIINKYNE